MSKIVLIGANHAGTAAANTLLKTYPENKLVIFDRNSNISYLGCGTALWIGRQIKGTDKLFYSSEEALRENGASIHMNTSATRIDYGAKIVYAVDKSGNEIAEAYDKLILATGSQAIVPAIPGINLKNVHVVKLFQDGQAIDAALNSDEVKDVAVIGAGYIGVELAEAVARRGKKAFLFDIEETSLSGYYDSDLTKEMDKTLGQNGVELHLGETLKEISGTTAVKEVVTDKGVYPIQLVILAVGFKPNTDLGREYLKTFANGAYEVNLNQQTSDKDVFAVGDCASVYSNALADKAYIALATNAVRSGIVAAHNAAGTPIKSIGVQGSNGISVFGLNMFSTGLSVQSAIKAGFDAAYTEYEDWQKPGFIETSNEKVKLKIVYDKVSRRILGAQMVSHQDVSMGIHLFSLAIQKQVTIEELALLDIFFLPHFNQPYNYITMAALSAKD